MNYLWIFAVSFAILVLIALILAIVALSKISSIYSFCHNNKCPSPEIPTEVSNIQKYTPTVVPGDNLELGSDNPISGYYMTIGKLKVCWGAVSFHYTQNTTRSSSSSVSLPGSFFTSVLGFLPSVSAVGDQPIQHVNGDGYSKDSIQFYVDQGTSQSNIASVKVAWLVLGN
jgi:hypothetical protein